MRDPDAISTASQSFVQHLTRMGEGPRRCKCSEQGVAEWLRGGGHGEGLHRGGECGGHKERESGGLSAGERGHKERESGGSSAGERGEEAWELGCDAGRSCV